MFVVSLLTAPDEEPVYVYDHRGLRVRASSLSKAQESTSANDSLSESQQKKDVRPKSASAATNKLSVCMYYYLTVSGVC